MVAAERDEMALAAVLKTRESPWHEDNLALFAGPRLRHVNIPTQAKRRLEWATGQGEARRRPESGIIFRDTRLGLLRNEAQWNFWHLWGPDVISSSMAVIPSCPVAATVPPSTFSGFRGQPVTALTVRKPPACD
jgi:hypothetical protein